VKLASEKLRYSRRTTKANPNPAMRRYVLDEISSCLRAEGLETNHLADAHGTGSALGLEILCYLNHRAEVIENEIRPNLMNRKEARREFETLRGRLNPKCELPMNKQKKDKSTRPVAPWSRGLERDAGSLRMASINGGDRWTSPVEWKA